MYRPSVEYAVRTYMRQHLGNPRLSNSCQVYIERDYGPQGKSRKRIYRSTRREAEAVCQCNDNNH